MVQHATIGLRNCSNVLFEWIEFWQYFSVKICVKSKIFFAHPLTALFIQPFSGGFAALDQADWSGN